MSPLSRSRVRAGIVILGAALAVLPVAACGSADGSAPGLERYYGQRLAWTECKPFDCTYLEVPLDYGRPDGDTARIAVLRQKASRPDQRIGSLLVNPGGPGAAGTDLAAALAPRLRGTPLGERFDLVGFDPRGVGASEPKIACFTPAEKDADRRKVDVDTSPAGVARVEEDARDYAAKCTQRSGLGLLANVGTRDVARDMDVLRAALGDEKLSYLGYSYGTRLGYTYAEQFPDRVRALVLDGALDPDQTTVDEVVAQGAGFQKAFDAFAAWCAGKQECPLGADPKAATATFTTLARATIAKPVPLADGRVLSYEDVISGTSQALYSPDMWELLRRGLTELADGHGETLMRLADAIEGRGTDGSYNGLQDVLAAVRCVDDKPVTDPAEALDASRRYLAAAPFSDDGHGPSPARDSCAFWPTPPTSEAHQPNVPGLPRTLVISVTGDPATPYQAGVNLARSLNAGLLTVHATQHGASLDGNACVDDLVTRYLVELTVPADGAQCTVAPG